MSGVREPVLSVRDLTVRFASESGIVQAVRGVNFDLYPGQTLGIVGESGSGKSVTTLAIMGLLDRNAAVEGSVQFRGEELLTKSDKEMSSIRGKNIAMVFQDPLSALTPVFTVGDQIAEALKIHNPTMSKADIEARTVELLTLVGIPSPTLRMHNFPHEFSGGMRQRVMIAMAIANDPDVIIADEPTTALDVTIQAQILEVLRTAQQETGAAVIFITHDMGVIAGMADEMIVMYAGRPVEKADVDELFHHPVQPYTMGLLGATPRADVSRAGRLIPIPGSPVNLVDLPQGCVFAPRCPLATDVCRREDPVLAAVTEDGHYSACHRTQEILDRGLTFEEIYTTSDPVESIFDGVDRSDRAQVLAVDGLRKTFPMMKGGLLRRKVGEVCAVDNVTFDIREGETMALVGESGSGKSTTLLSIMDLVAPQGGTVEVFGVPVDSSLTRAARRDLRRNIQFVFQDPMSSLDPRLPIYDSLAEPLKVHGFSRSEIHDRVIELMRLVELNPDQVDRFPMQFSGGQRQRIAIARALAVNPKLILLDEPVSALDVSIQAGVINLLEDLQNKLGVAYLFVAHNLSVVRHISSRIAVMYVGRVVESGPVDQVYDNPRHPYTKALLSAMPIPDPAIEKTRERIVLEGDAPSPSDDVVGCIFASRCPVRALLPEELQHRCVTETPLLRGDDHQVACHAS